MDGFTGAPSRRPGKQMRSTSLGDQACQRQALLARQREPFLGRLTSLYRYRAGSGSTHRWQAATRS
jgi:lipase chaperone LimK